MRRRTRSPACHCELEKVVGGADHGPFAPDLIEAAQEELAEASGMLDLSEHRLDHLLALPVNAAPPALPRPPPCPAVNACAARLASASRPSRSSGLAWSAFGAPRHAPRRGALGPAPG